MPVLCVGYAAVLDSSSTGTSKRGQPEVVPAVAQLSKSGREVYVTQAQSGKAFLLVLDLNSKQLLDVVKVRNTELLGCPTETCMIACMPDVARRSC